MALAQPAPASGDDLRSALLVAEDARVASPAQLETVNRGLASAAADIRVLTLRTAGRTQRTEFLPRAVTALRDPSIDVRREAAFAVAHIGSGGDPDALVSAAEALRGALTIEADTFVFASLAENLGRLPFPDTAAIERAVTTIRAGLEKIPGGSAALASLGAARAAESLARRAARLKVPSAELQRWLASLAATGAAAGPPARPDALTVRIRRLAVSGLLSLDAMTPELTAAALTDQDAQVRRTAVIALSRRPAAGEGLPLLKDPNVLVRHAVVTRLGPKTTDIAMAALADAHVHVRLAAIDVLGQAGACSSACTTRLDREGAFEDGQWHEAAHALVALSRSAADRARPYVTRARDARVWQVRMYAARAAGVTRQDDVLRGLAADSHVNVRHSALAAWREAKLPGLADAAVEALASDDGQLLLEAATALKGATVSPAGVKALRNAFDRVTAQRRDTSRDPRLALLERIDEHDAQRDAPLRAALNDFDPAVADRAAALLNARVAPGDTRAVAAANSQAARSRMRVPTWDEVRRLEATTITFTLRRERTLTMRVFPQVAPMAVARLVDQVRAGEWDGKTLHRVEPGFVVQGGSPAANEYEGAAAFARDEFSGLSNVRGTVGISTRGPDTGDGQIYVNLIDNVRLDFAFTLVGSIAGDLAILDDLLEGEEIVAAAVVTAQ